jgi:hypothetical protein
MSLIVDINPVPWKILDLVKARILKNRTKKAKKGLDWSKETLRREMALPSAPLISRKRDEPSFIPSGRFVTYTIEGARRYFTISGSVNGARKRIGTSWTVFVQWEGQATQPEGRDKQPILRVVSDNDTDWNLNFSGPNVDTFYISQFESLETGDEGLPLFVFSSAAASGRAAVAYSMEPPFSLDDFPASDYDSFNDTSSLFDYQISRAFLHPSVALGNEISIMSTNFNPLQAWTRTSYGATTASNPLSNEYDISKIEAAPGYIETSSLSFPDGTCPAGFVSSGVIYEAHVTTPPWGFSSSIYEEIVAASPPQVTGGSNWSITWTSLHGEQKSYSRDLYPPDSEWSDPFRPLGPAGPPPYVILQYVKQIGTVKDCMISMTVNP